MIGIHHQPFGNKIKTGLIYISAGSPYHATAVTRSLMYETGNGGVTGVVSTVNDDLGLFTVDTAMATGITYLTISSNVKYINIFANMGWAANATGRRVLELMTYTSPTSGTPFSLISVINAMPINSAANPTTLYSQSGFREVKTSGTYDGKFSTAENYMFFCYQNSGGNLSHTISYTFMGYTALLR